MSALVQAPYGYRYRGKADGADPPVGLDEARVVRQIFDWVGRERLTIATVARRLTTQGLSTRTGNSRWDRGTVRQILKNSTYKGEATYGKTHSISWRRLALRPAKHHQDYPRHSSSVVPAPAEEWITIPTPALVEPALFAAVQEQLEENRRRCRERKRGAQFLLQGLLVCEACGYTLWARVTRYHTRDGQAYARVYYRCLGSDPHRYGGVRLCAASPPAAPPVEAAVWAEVCCLLEDPRRIEREYRRRWSAANAPRPPLAEQANAAHLSKLRQGLARLIDSYTDGLIAKEEFAPRLSRLRQRIAQLEEGMQREREETNAIREVRLVMGQVESFATQVREGLADAQWPLRRDIIRALVKRIAVTDEHITMVFRVGTPSLGPAPPGRFSQHCLPRLSLLFEQTRGEATGGLRDPFSRTATQSHL
ncbi:MAG: recombinase family protein [Ktedonobacterales bacterium]